MKDLTPLQKFLLYDTSPKDDDSFEYLQVRREPVNGDYIKIIYVDESENKDISGYEIDDILLVNEVDSPGVYCRTQTQDRWYIASYEFVVVEKVGK